MAVPDFNRQLQNDSETLRLILSALEQLEVRWRQAQVSVEARRRGYFTPDEDDAVRQLLLAYRNYRIALYEIIHRYESYRAIPAADDRLRGFLLGLATALTLYSYSLKMIQAYEREPLVRAKLNEPDLKFEIEAGFFEEVLRSYSSLGNYWAFIKGIWFWQSHRRMIQKIARTGEWRWIVDYIRRERVLVRKRLVNVLLCRLRYDWKTFWRTVFQPVYKTRYGMQSLIGGACAGLRTTFSYQPALTQSVFEQLRSILKTGDVLLVRAEEKLTSAMLPGFWAHAALFVGSRSDLERLGIASHKHVSRHLDDVERHSKPHGSVIEAISPRVLINSLEASLHADHVAVLRPNLPANEIGAAVAEAFGHLGKPYDFEFDFNVSTRLVCTEVIYRSYHRRGTIQFSLVKRLGRFTLTADDIAAVVLNGAASEKPAPEVSLPFSLTALFLKNGSEARLIPGNDAMEKLRLIHTGWRPGPQPKAA